MKPKVLVGCGVLVAGLITVLAWSGPMDSGLPNFHGATVSLHGPLEREAVTLSFADLETLAHLFEGVPRDRNPAKWQVLGTVRLFDESGQQVSQIEVFSNAGGPGPFRIGGNYFLGYDQTLFLEMLRDAEAEMPR